MIEASSRWRFVATTNTNAYYDEEIVQHLLIEKQALRRSLSAKTEEDSVARDAIVEHARLAAQSTAGAGPVLFHMEVVNSRETFLFELVEGRALTDMIAQNIFLRTEAWATTAEAVANAFLELRDSGAHLDRVDISQLIITEQGEARFNTVALVGDCSANELERSAILQRLARQDRQGVYFSEKPKNEPEELQRLLEIIARMIMGPGRTNVEGYIRDLGSEESNVDPRIREILLSMFPSAMGSTRCNTIEEAHRALASLHTQELQQRLVEGPKRRSSSSSSTATDPSSVSSGGIGNVSTVKLTPPVASIKTPVPSGRRTPTPPSSTPRTIDDSNPYALSEENIPKPAPASRPSALLREMPKLTTKPAVRPEDEESNPFAIPPAPMDFVPKTSSYSGSTVKKQLGKDLIVKLAAVLVGVGLLVGAVIFVVGLIANRPEPNEKPTVQMAPLAKSNYANNEPIRIDLSGSSDPDNDPLTYYIRLIEPATGNMVFINEGSQALNRPPLHTTTVSKFEIRIFDAGSYTFEVYVNDGQAFSESIRFSVAINGQ